jgi:hypothetical protein
MIKPIFALAAIAIVGAGALITSVSSADARPGFSRGGSVHFGGHRGGFRHAGIVHRPHFHHHRHHHWHWKRYRPYVYGAVAAAAIAAPAHAAAAPKPAAAPCTCLTKEYTKDNLVVFMDRCTKEAAASPAGGPQQQSQAPQQEPGDTEPMPTK